MELLRRYSNQAHLIDPVRDALRRIAEGDNADEPGICSKGRRADRLRAALPKDEQLVKELAAAYRAGTAVSVLAARHGLSPSTIYRVMRARGITRR